VAEFSAGTALLPSITRNTDLDTGMWFPAANTVAWSTGGTERMRISSAGDVGIGTTSPGTWGKFAAVGTASGSQVVVAIVNTATAVNTQAVLSFDTTTAGFNVRDSQIRSTNDGANETTLEFWTSGNGAPPVERMRIAPRGNVGIGLTTNNLDARLTVRGSGTSSSTTGLLIEDSGGTDNFAIRDDGGYAFRGGTVGLAQTGYTTFANLVTDRTCDADTVTVAELADIVGTLIVDLKTKGIIAS